MPSLGSGLKHSVDRHLISQLVNFRTQEKTAVTLSTVATFDGSIRSLKYDKPLK